MNASNFFPIECEMVVSEEVLRRNTPNMTYISPRFNVDGKTIVCYFQRNSDIMLMNIAFIFDDKRQTCVRGKFAFYCKSASFELFADHKFRKTESTWKLPFCEFNDVLNQEKRFIENEKLTIQMKGILFFDSFLEGQKPSTALGHFLWDRDDRDFIVSVGKEDGPKTVIKVHSYVLASRSPVFNRMLQTDMKEKSEGKVEITDFNPDIVQYAVEYFYDRDVYKSLNLNELIDVFRFAEKYDVKDLKKNIEYIFIDNLRSINFNQISYASVAANAPMLKNVCDCLSQKDVNN